MRRVLAALCLLVGLSAEAQVRTVWTNQAATATSSAYDTGRAQHTNIQIIGSSVVGTVDIEKSNDCSTWTNHQTLTDPSNTFLTLPSWACTRLVFTRTSGTITLATIEPVRTGRNGTMVGATSGAAGIAGLVPPPQAGDEAKVLLGDGTWGAGGGGSGDITSVTLTGTAPVTVTGSPCASADCAFTLALTGVTLDANGWTQSVPVTGGDANKGYAWNVATDGGYPDFGMSLVLGGLTLTGDDQEFHARKQITVHANASGGGLDGFCFEKAAAEACMVYDFTGNVLQLPTVTLANPLAVADGGTGVSSFGQNTVLAGPTSGGAGTATARSLVAGDIPTLNQNTTGSAATLTTARNIFGQSFDGSAALAGLGTFNLDNLGTTSTDGILLSNNTAATSGVTAQYSPRLRFVGSGWKTTATAAAQQTEWYVENVPFSRAAAPSNSIGFTPVRNGSAATDKLWMCQSDGAANNFTTGLVFGGTYGRCDNSTGFNAIGTAGSLNVGFWLNSTLTISIASSAVVMPSTLPIGWSSTTLGLGATNSTLDTHFVRQAAGVVGVRGASSARGAILGARVVAAQASTPYTLVDPTDIDKVYTNEGATASIVFNLPTAVAGLTYTFIVQDADGLSVVAASGDTIRIAASVSAAAGNIASTTIGNTVILVAINATEWVAIAVNGTWTVT